MMKKQRFSRSCLVIVILALIVVVLGASAFLILRGVSKVKVEGNIPPTIIVNSPVMNESVMAGGFLLANVTATGQNPIARLELWFDGTLLETQTPGAELGDVTTFYANASIPMTEGSHMFSARAVDAKGLVGQSLPISVQGIPRLSQNETDPSQPPPSGDTPPLPPPSGDTPPLPPPSGDTPPQPPASPAPVTIIPPAPIQITPPGGIPVLKVIEYKPIDIGSLLPILLSGRPNAPTSLQAGFENCTIRLVWMDNADNETYFNVWMQALGGPPRVISTLDGSPQTGPAWYEFPSPWSGIYSFWIEAVNGLGGQSSEIAWVGVTDLSCGPGVATHLNIEVIDMYIPGGYDQAYCYLSVENTPEKRFPLNEWTFFQVLGGWGDVSNWTDSGKSILVPFPADDEITLDTKCLGRQAASQPITLGAYPASSPKETWDGRRLEIKGPGYTIGYRIKPRGPETVSGFFNYTDYTIPSPSQPWITINPSSNPAESEKFARRPTLHWYWAGDPDKLTGFTILLDGKFFRSVPNWQGGTPGKWEQMFLLPNSCGVTYKFQVVANSGEAQSAPSPLYEYKQPLCKLYAEVKFETITFTDVDDDEPGSCDSAEAFYGIMVNDEYRGFGNDSNRIDMTCGTFYFDRLPALMPQEHEYSSVDTFIVPLSSQDHNVNIYVHFVNDLYTIFDLHFPTLCYVREDIIMSSLEWANLIYPENIQFPCRDKDEAKGFVTISVRGIIAP